MIYYFEGNEEEMRELSNLLFENDYEILDYNQVSQHDSWLEDLQNIVIAVLGSSLLTGIITKIIEAKYPNISIEFEDENKKCKITCQKGSKKDVIDILSEAGFIKSDNLDDNKNRK